MNSSKQRTTANGIIQAELGPLLREKVASVKVARISARLVELGLSERYLRNYLRDFLPTLTIEAGVILRGPDFVPGTVDPVAEGSAIRPKPATLSASELEEETERNDRRRAAAQKRLKELEVEYDRLKAEGKL